MFKKIIELTIILFLFGCASNNYESNYEAAGEAIESGILWNAELDSVTWEPIEMSKVATSNKLFKKEGGFYKSTTNEIYAFNSKVQYIGLIGVELLAGPNALVEGTASDVAERISKKYNLKLYKKGNAFVSRLNKSTELIVMPHPNIDNSTIVIGAYFGR